MNKDEENNNKSLPLLILDRVITGLLLLMAGVYISWSLWYIFGYFYAFVEVCEFLIGK